MSGTSDERGTRSDASGKRPTPTIEGTATEVSVDAVAGDAKTEAPKAALPSAGAPDDETSPPGDDGTESDDEATEADDERPAAPAPERRSFGSRLLGGLATLFTHALAGVAGGLAVLAALSLGYLPSGSVKDAAGVGAIENRVTALESAPKTPDSASELESLKSRLATLESQTSGAQEPSASPADVEALSARVAQMETSLASMADAAKDGGDVADAAAISQQVAEAEQRLDKQIESKVQSEIQAALASGTAGSGSNTKAIETLKSEIASIDAKLKALAEAELNSDGVAKLMPDIAELEDRLGRIESTLPPLVNALDEENAQTKKASVAIAYASLREAVNAGRPYATELTTLTALSPGANDLGDLIDYEDRGIPTVSMLTASFGRLRDEVLSAGSDGNADSLLGQLMGNAQALVKIRRIGERLLAIPHIRRMRFASKGPAVMPQKILTDDEWFSALADVVAAGRKAHKDVCLHTHFNHPNEITEITERAMNRLMEAGIHVRNQSVLLRGVNDTVAAMGMLIKRMSYVNVHGYYVYQHDLVRGVEDLRTTIRTSIELEKQVRGLTAGYNSPLFIVDAPGGGGKRDVHSFEHYNPVTGVSVYRSPNVKRDAFYCYFDPIDRLPEEGKARWADPSQHDAIVDEAIEAAKAQLR